MATENVKYFAMRSADDLFDSRSKNVDRYVEGDFQDYISAPGAVLALSNQIEMSFFSELDPNGGPDAEVKNSLLVWNGLKGLTPNLACENRIWTYLCHGPGLIYSRARWLRGIPKSDISAAAEKHFFANTQTRCRDDNSIGRLWWNAFIAQRSAPDNFEEGLKLILKTADIRSNFVERTWMTSRKKVAVALVRQMALNPWVTNAEVNFRETMKSLNIEGAGVAFEIMPSGKVDSFVLRAIDRAQSEVSAKNSVSK